MMMKRVLVCVLLLVLASPLRSQWTLTSSAMLGHISQDVGAMTFKSGVVWAGTSSLWQSNDSGKTWTHNALILTSEVAHINFLDRMNGLVTTHGGTVYRTKDGGVSWDVVKSLGSASSAVFIDAATNILVSEFSPGNVYSSTDAGSTWKSVANNNWIREIIAGKNGHAYMLSGTWVDDEHIWLTSDYGATWTKQPGYTDADSYSFEVSNCGSQNIIVVNEEYSITGEYDGKSEIFVSSDVGNTWSVKANYPSKYFSGGIGVGPSMVFCPTVSEANAGVLRSADNGLTWTSIGGPSSSGDTRLIAVIDDNHVVACDVNGSIYITENSGGYPVNSGNVMRVATVPNISACSQARAVETLLGPNCGSTFTVTGIVLSGDPHFALDSLTTPPFTLGAGTSNSFGVHFDPKKQGGSFSATLHVTGTIQSSTGSTTFDTVIELNVQVQPELPSLVASPGLLDFGSISACGKGADSVLHFTNLGCFPDTLTAQTFAGSGFTMPSLSLPIIIRPDSTFSERVHFSPASSGNYSGTVTITLTSQGLTRQYTLSVLGSATQGVGVLALPQSTLRFDTLTPCSNDTSLYATLANTGCDTLAITKLLLSSAPNYLTASSLHDTVLPPGATLRYKIIFHPDTAGNKPGSLSFRSKNIHGNVAVIDTTIMLAGVVHGGSNSATLSANTYALGPISSCSEMDTTLTIYATGCDTIVITDASFSNSGFALIPTPVFPIRILPGGRKTLTFQTHLDSLASGIQYADTLNVTSNSNPLLTPIIVSAQLRPEAPQLLANITTVDLGDISTCGTGLDTQIVFTNKGCKPDTLTRESLVGSGFDVSNLMFPIVVQPDSSVGLHVHFAPQSAGISDGTLDLFVTSQGKTEDIGIELHVNTIQGTGVLNVVDQALSFSNLTICSNDTILTGRITNSGCDSLLITKQALLGGADFSTPASLRDTALPPHDTIYYRIFFHPGSKGSAKGALHFNSQNLHGTGPVTDTVIHLDALVLDGSKLLSQDVQSVDYGKTSVCEERDSSVTLTNTGCDTVWINAASFSNPSFDFVTTPTFPIRLLPHEHKQFAIETHLDTTGHPGLLSGTLNFTTTSLLPLMPVTFTRSIAYPEPLALALKDPVSATPNRDVSFKLIPMQAIPQSVTSIQFDVTYNENLLDYRGFDGPGVSMIGESFLQTGHRVRTYRISPVLDTSILATLNFHSVVAEDNATPISISNVRVNDLDSASQNCLVFIDTSGSQFGAIGQCGTALLQEFLANSALIFDVGNPYPNPVGVDGGSHPGIPFHTGMGGVASLLVFDALGRESHSETMTLKAAGDYFFDFNADALSAGRYECVLEFPGSAPITRSIAVVK